MKTYRIIAVLFAFFIATAGLSAQSAEGIIKDYIDALGGQKKLDKVTSVQMKSLIESDMFEAEAHTTVLNGKGYKMEMDVQGYLIETCFTDKGGWRTDPMAGTTVEIPEEEFKMGKGAIYVAGPFQNYKDMGITAELVGRKEINGVNAYHLRLSMEGTEITPNHYFDPKSHLLIRTVVVVDNQGMEMEAITEYKDYKEIEGGIKIAHVMDIDYGGQMSMTNTISEVKVNVPVDESIFERE